MRLFCGVSQEATAKIDEYARGMISGSGSTLFEELGLYYIGPIDGHNLELLITMLQGAHTAVCHISNLLSCCMETRGLKISLTGICMQNYLAVPG